jgi:N-methylhydantoinase B
MMLGHGVEVPNSIGQFGGMPGACGRNFIRREVGDSAAIAGFAGSLDEMLQKGVEELGPKPGHMNLSKRDVLGYAFQGGGGYGDPLKRDPQAVRADVLNGHVSAEGAKTHYGVVIIGKAVDAAATDAARAAIRARRLGGKAPGRAAGTGGLKIGRTRFACSCGADLGPVAGNWKDKALTRKPAPGEYGRHIRTHAELELREHVCRDCGSLLEAEVVRKDEASLASINLGA